MPNITDREFAQFQRFIYGRAGISLSDSKKALVSGRLAKRLAVHQLSSYSQYLRLMTAGESPAELQIAVDLLTTNETYFFREPRHFEFLRGLTAGRNIGGAQFRVWSAAGSTGEEAYSIAMVLEDCIPGQWEVMGSDISSRVLSAPASDTIRPGASRKFHPRICSASAFAVWTNMTARYWSNGSCAGEPAFDRST